MQQVELILRACKKAHLEYALSYKRVAGRERGAAASGCKYLIGRRNLRKKAAEIDEVHHFINAIHPAI